MNNKLMVYSPVNGEIIPVSQIKDAVFQYELFGRGVSISPSSNKILSPVAGVIESIAKEKHSIIIETAEGVKIWIYIGNDIVQLNGAFIKCFVEEKQHVEVGDALFDCDFYEMKEQGYHIEVSITVKEHKDIFEVIKMKDGTIKKKEPLAGILFYHR
ncbi:MAG: PTS glucose transporter subunit IIA [Candidatus Galacturonibacter soehngenii]|nr:PTS glucose transporter subunit IIA [Candidatus Galacturonibacter soehngenii]